MRDRDVLDAFSRGGCRELLGVLGIALGAGLLALEFGFGGDDLVIPGEPGLSAPSGAAQSEAAAESQAAAPSTADAPAATDEPATPPTGSALALVDFTGGAPPCPVDAFQSGFRAQSDAGALTLTQLVPGGEPHVSTGTVDQGGAWETMGDMQSYRGMFVGSRMTGMYSQPDGCEYMVRGFMDRPFLWPSPWGDAPGRFELFDPETGEGGLALEHVPEGSAVHVIVGSNGDPDIRTFLPILIVLLIDDEEVWEFLIEGDPSAVCRDETGCSADAPSPRMAEWDDEGVELLLVAYAADGTVIAVHTTRSEPPEKKGISDTTAPPAPTAAPTSAAATGEGAADATDEATTVAPGTPAIADERDWNWLLIVLAVALIIFGIGWGFGPRIVRVWRPPEVA